MIEDMHLRSPSRAPQQLGDLGVVDLLDGYRIVKVAHASLVLLESKSLAVQGWVLWQASSVGDVDGQRLETAVPPVGFGLVAGHQHPRPCGGRSDEGQQHLDDRQRRS